MFVVRVLVVSTTMTTTTTRRKWFVKSRYNVQISEQIKLHIYDNKHHTISTNIYTCPLHSQHLSMTQKEGRRKEKGLQTGVQHTRLIIRIYRTVVNMTKDNVGERT